MTRGIHFRLYLGQNIPQPLRAVCSCDRRTESSSWAIAGGFLHAFANLQANRRP